MSGVPNTVRREGVYHFRRRVDKVIFTLIGTGTKPNVVPAQGSCTYTNPYAGPSRISCSATTKAGRFSGSFISDGQLPDIQEF